MVKGAYTCFDLRFMKLNDLLSSFVCVFPDLSGVFKSEILREACLLGLPSLAHRSQLLSPKSLS